MPAGTALTHLYREDRRPDHQRRNSARQRQVDCALQQLRLRVDRVNEGREQALAQRVIVFQPVAVEFFSQQQRALALADGRVKTCPSR